MLGMRQLRLRRKAGRRREALEQAEREAAEEAGRRAVESGRRSPEEEARLREEDIRREVEAEVRRKMGLQMEPKATLEPKATARATAWPTSLTERVSRPLIEMIASPTRRPFSAAEPSGITSAIATPSAVGAMARPN